ncbi:hypothetical protein Spico_1244 [Parasphaerochaeta coccoides DSM 17374]|uniref:Alpha/beta hydrolase n=1 Tax=Parasphaerochaeta coccoides (strain ATCC BAA-1237 / DSM 17374 / SPN1) TaxID=760011 RepID=F4GLR0_PARC1|nr:hypothetical protein Spico_1244 [Parasphaerochaeta coccoides DSM 17374]
MLNGIYSKHHMLTLAGGSLSVYEAGDEHILPVLLIHGTMYSEYNFHL